ncbi:MAG: efflux RND transporter permease subunit [Cytophagales bacterium]|nr:efflux RND transporter permease subunit [Cytophagales bacterium]
MVAFLIKRPIGTSMVCIMVIVIGILASQQLPVSLMPDVDIPEIIVQSNHENYTAEQMEQLVLHPLRHELQQTLNLDEISSVSQNGQGTITLRFLYGSNISQASIEINEKVDLAMRFLPEELQRPKVIKASALDIPVFTLNVSRKSIAFTPQEFLELSEFTEMVLKRRIEQIPEVAFVDISGFNIPEIHVTFDSAKVSQLKLEMEYVAQIIKANNREIGNILMREGHYQYHVKIGTGLRSIDDLADIKIKIQDRIFQLDELASLSITPEKEMGQYFSNGKRAIALNIIKKSDAQVEKMAKGVKQVISQLEFEYPKLNFDYTRDQSRLLLVTIAALKQSLFVGAMLAFVVMFLFLSDVRAPLLVGLSIPLSVIVSLLIFQLVNLSVNIISLSGLLLGVGMMIDNSIIVIDNISQRLNRGDSLMDACEKGSTEIFRPLLSSVLTTCAVFLPLVFLSGISGALFKDQALAVTIGLSSSLLVSISIIPVYFNWLFSSQLLNQLNATISLRPFDLSRLYKSGFNWASRHPRIMLLIMIFNLIGTLPLYFLLEKRIFPELTELDTELIVDWNENIHIDENQERTKRLLKVAQDWIQESNSLLGKQQFILSNSKSAQSTNEAIIYIKAATEAELGFARKVILEHVQCNYPRASIKFSNPENAYERLFTTSEPPLTVQLSLNSSPRNSLNVVDSLEQFLRRTFPEMLPQPTESIVNISLVHENLLRYNIESKTVINVLQTILNDYQLGELKSSQRLVKIKTSMEKNEFGKMLKSAKVQNVDGHEFPLTQVISVTSAKTFKHIYANRDRIYYPYSFHISERELAFHMNEFSQLVAPYNSVNLFFTGSLLKNRVLIKEFTIVLIIALVFLYFILTVQFESTWLPLIILTEVPMTLMACFLGLYLTCTSLNIMSLIGIVVMSGIIVNDSILKLDTINKLRKSGYTIDEAISIGGERRLKPILMTSLTTILALVPFFFSQDLGSELQQPLAITVIFGMFMGTFISLYYIPLLYRWVLGGIKLYNI